MSSKQQIILSQCRNCSRRRCKCGRIALGYDFCWRCPKPPCCHHQKPYRCGRCWQKIPLSYLCRRCNCDYLTGCICPGEQGYDKKCPECIESQPNLTLPRVDLLPEPIPPDHLDWYEREMRKWVEFYLESGMSRHVLSTFLPPAAYFDPVEFEFYSRTEVQHQTFAQILLQLDSERQQVHQEVMSLNLFPDPLIRLIARLTVP